MVALGDIFSLVDLNDEIANGYVTARSNDAGTLAILNYTPKAQYDNRWNDVTMACRGLIYNTRTMEVVARPFEKFFNWDQGVVKYPPPGPVLRMPKMDGSLGILYWDESRGKHCIATRGSFLSEQAIEGTAIYERMKNGFVPQPGKTYLFEIIY